MCPYMFCNVCATLQVNPKDHYMRKYIAGIRRTRSLFQVCAVLVGPVRGVCNINEARTNYIAHLREFGDCDLIFI